MKENEWKPLSEATKGLIAKLRYKVRGESTYPGGASPVFAKRQYADWRWLQRRFYLAFGETAISIIWVDDDDSCADQHITYTNGSTPGDWHQYEDAKHQIWAVRCPSSLEAKFKVRLEADDPPGHALNKLREARSNRKENKRRANIKRVQQQDME